MNNIDPVEGSEYLPPAKTFSDKAYPKLLTGCAFYILIAVILPFAMSQNALVFPILVIGAVLFFWHKKKQRLS